MLARINAVMTGLNVAWKGENKNKTTGKYSLTMQVYAQYSDGRMENFYMSAFDPAAIEQLVVGDRIDAEVSVRAFKDGLYITLIKAYKVAAKKPVTV